MWRRLSAASAVLVAVVAAIGAIVAPRAARAQTPAAPWRSRLALTADARGELGRGDVAGIELGLVAAGIEWQATPTLRLRATALALGSTGSTDTGQAAHRGAGGELAARIVPFPRWPVRPYLRASAGMLLFLRRPFLPGGDVYDFIIQAGAGLEVSVGDRLSLFGDLHAVHLSNGQGLGSFNPAFTGEGGLIGAAYALGPPDVPAGAPDQTAVVAVDEARPTWHPGATFEAGAGNAGGSRQFSARDRVAERLSQHTLALMDIESGEIGSSHFLDAGLDLAGHWTWVSAGVHTAYRRFAGTGTFIEQAQVEANVSPEASLVAMADWEIPNRGADTMRAATILRLFPIEAFVIELGGGTRRIAGTPTSRADVAFKPCFAIEWQLPLPSAARTWQVSLFLERQLEDLQLAGARISWDMGATLRDIARRTGWRRLR